MSTMRPGVPTATSHPSRSVLTSPPTSVPPTKRPAEIVGSLRFVAKDAKKSRVCSARSRTGSNTIALGVRPPCLRSPSFPPAPFVFACVAFVDRPPEDAVDDPRAREPFIVIKFPSARATPSWPGGGGYAHGACPKFTTHSAFFRHTAGNSARPFMDAGIENAADSSSPDVSPEPRPEQSRPLIEKLTTPATRSTEHPTTSPAPKGSPNVSNVPPCDFFPVPPNPNECESVPRPSSDPATVLHPHRTKPSSLTVISK
mmetsp:Transcript_7827/g.34526  ORF Transcript_7827/g.34526 Transcript_7827/m.34526 type:complete len:257 (+) Transcript_7827:724-1494(+)